MAPSRTPPMVPAQPPKRRGERRKPVPRGWPWQTWLLVGLCFGLGYGLTQRLARFGGGGGGIGTPRFGEKGFPGTGLDSLRQRSGGGRTDIRADLEKAEREQRLRREREEMEKRKAEVEKREAAASEGQESAQDREQRELERERARRESLERTPEPSSPPGQEAVTTPDLPMAPGATAPPPPVQPPAPVPAPAAVPDIPPPPVVPAAPAGTP